VRIPVNVATHSNSKLAVIPVESGPVIPVWVATINDAFIAKD
jgi:hypothetical protein